MRFRAWLTRHLGAPVTAEGGHPERLAALQRDLLVPLELEALAGHAGLSAPAGAISQLRNQLPLPGPQDRRERPPAADGSTT